MSNSKTCPVCGSDEAYIPRKVIAKRMLFDKTSVEFEAEVGSCPVCEEEFYLEDIDKNFELAKDKALEHNLIGILENIKKKCSSLSNFERLFNIPQRTSNRWKNSSVTSIGYALLSTVNQLPWLVDIVEAKFNKQAMATIMLKETEKLFCEIASENGCTLKRNITAGEGSWEVTYNLVDQYSSNTVEIIEENHSNLFYEKKCVNG